MALLNPATPRPLVAIGIPLSLNAPLALVARGAAICQSWVQQLANKGLKVNDQSVGAGGGVAEQER